LIIPVYLTTRKVKKKFREMHEQMRQDGVNPGSPQNPPSSGKAQPQPNKNDYIDFREVRVNTSRSAVWVKARNCYIAPPYRRQGSLAQTVEHPICCPGGLSFDFKFF
jgi:hypothetical protein